jgi:putative acetyltransferase
MTRTLIIRAETPDDYVSIRDINRRAFGRDDEAILVDALREQGYSRVSLVAVEDGLAIGHILFSDLPIVTQERTVPDLALAPLAVIPSRQRRGIGSALVQAGLRICADQGHGIVIVLGHPDYYPRFGFSASRARSLNAPFSGAAFMALELVSGALGGIVGEVHYPPPFGIAARS